MFFFYFCMFLSILLGVLYHEYGHMKISKKYGIKVSKYCIGLGPMIWKKKGKDETEYGIAPLPFGGYCIIDEVELDKRPLYQYSHVFLAGVIRNIIIGIPLCMIGLSLIFIGSGQVPDLFEIVKSTFGMLIDTFSLFGTVIVAFFDIQGIAEVGGIGSQMEAIGTPFATLQMNTIQYIGMGLAMGGGMNFALALCNILPIPALDGGQLVIKYIRVLAKKLFHFEISKHIADVINTAGFAFLLFYQGIIFMCDIPAVQNFILGL